MHPTALDLLFEFRHTLVAPHSGARAAFRVSSRRALVVAHATRPERVRENRRACGSRTDAHNSAKDGRASGLENFANGFLKDGVVLGRPAGLATKRDGALYLGRQQGIHLSRHG
jgi:glucose/arabinose dehydrogenase